MAEPKLAEPTLDDLAALQAALLEALDQPLGPDELMARLRNDPALAPFRGYADAFESRMVEVAALLVKKWGRRKGEDKPSSGTAEQ